MYINVENTTMVMQYIKDNPTITFNETVGAMTTMGYTVQVGTLWLESFTHGSFTYGIITEDTFDSLKQKAIGSDITLGAKVAEVVEIYLTKNPVYFKVDNVIHNLLTKEEIYLSELQQQIDNLQMQIDNCLELKTVPDQETLEFYNGVIDITFKENLIVKRNEVQDLLDELENL